MSSEIARTIGDVGTQMAIAEDSVSYIIYAPREKFDRNLVKVYVLRLDRSLGKFIGLASRCVRVDGCFGEYLDPGQTASDQPYPRALKAARDRVRTLTTGLDIGALSMTGALSLAPSRQTIGSRMTVTGAPDGVSKH